MNSKTTLAILLLVLILPGITLLSRPSLIGVDGYGFYNAICGKDEFPGNTESVALLIFERMPCNENLIKLIEWFFYTVLIGLIALLGYTFFGKAGLIAPLFAWLSTYFLFFPWELENDLLATPFLWFSIYLLVLDKKLEATLLVLFTGAFLWGGAWFFLLLIGLSFYPALLLLAGLLVVFPAKIIGTFLPNSFVAENMLFGGMITLFMLCVGFAAYAMHNKTIKPLFKQAMLFLPVMVLSGKYSYHALPILSIGVVALIEEFKQAKQFLIIAGLVMLVVLSFGMMDIYPHASTLQAVREGIALSEKEGKPLLNDWDIGYYLEYYNYDTNYKGGIPNPDYNKAKNAIIISQFDLNFRKVESFGAYSIYSS